jgi:hypothetical protein
MARRMSSIWAGLPLRLQMPAAGAGHLGGKLEPLRDVPEGRFDFLCGDVLDHDEDTDHRSVQSFTPNIVQISSPFSSTDPNCFSV